MDPTTQLASNLTVGQYRALREQLGTMPTMNGEAWQQLVSAARGRITERFLEPIDALIRAHTPRSNLINGFAIVALDCLLIDAIQAFREGRVRTGEGSSAKSFKAFWSTRHFEKWKRELNDGFFDRVRNAILHNGETRKDWVLNRKHDQLLSVDPKRRTKTLNPYLFHRAVKASIDDYFAALAVASDEKLVESFLRRMDALAGIEEESHLYFAYGSNLDPKEMLRTAPNAVDVGLALLPGYRLGFAKHSATRGCDAATIVPDPHSVVWGWLYQIDGPNLAQLALREGGYEKQRLCVMALGENGSYRPANCVSFIAKKRCELRCGPSAEYRGIVVAGARARNLPDEYISKLLVLDT